jgi:hypothetical protein
MVADDVRRRISVRKPIPPPDLGGYAAVTAFDVVQHASRDYAAGSDPKLQNPDG